MRFEVLLTQDAENDLEELYTHVAEFDSLKSADHLLERLLEMAASLSMTPERGSHPQELRALGIQEYRQVFLKPYRMIYRVIDSKVVVYVIADGRRDMQALLVRRLLNS